MPIHARKSIYLYNPDDIWRFTMLWTVMLFGAIHFAAAAWACVVQWRNWKLIWITPVVYLIIGGLEGFVAGSVVGGLYVHRSTMAEDCRQG